MYKCYLEDHPEVATGSAEETPLCEPCRADGKELEAHGFCNNCKEYMCPSCIKYHGRLTATKHHNVIGKQKMPTYYRSSKKAIDVSGFDLCQHHPSEPVRFFCKEHEQSGCGDCIVLNHRVCTVDYIPDVALSFTASSEFKVIVDKSVKFEEDLKKCDEILNANEQSVLDLCIIELKQLQDFRVEINEYLDKREKILKKSMENARMKDTDLIRRLLKDVNASKSTLAETNSGLKAQNNNANQLYVKARHAEKLFEEMERLIKKVKTSNLVTRYKFSRDKKTKDLLSWEDAIGKVDEQTRESIGKKADKAVEMVNARLGAKIAASREQNYIEHSPKYRDRLNTYEDPPSDRDRQKPDEVPPRDIDRQNPYGQISLCTGEDQTRDSNRQNPYGHVSLCTDEDPPSDSNRQNPYGHVSLCTGEDPPRDSNRQNPYGHVSLCTGEDPPRDSNRQNPYGHVSLCTGEDPPRDSNRQNPYGHVSLCTGEDPPRDSNRQNPYGHVSLCTDEDPPRDSNRQNPYGHVSLCTGEDPPRDSHRKNPYGHVSLCTDEYPPRDSHRQNPKFSRGQIVKTKIGEGSSLPDEKHRRAKETPTKLGQKYLGGKGDLKFFE